MSSCTQTWYESCRLIDFVIIRHGVSNGNIASYCKEHIRDDDSEEDPLLSTEGIEQSKTMNVPLHIDATTVCCSTMTRAMMTALCMFPTKTIYVVPYVQEHGEYKKCPFTIEEKKKRIDSILGVGSSTRLDFSCVDQEGEKAHCVSNPNAFFTFFPTTKVATTLQMKSTLALVIHGGIMRDDFLRIQNSVANNSMFSRPCVLSDKSMEYTENGNWTMLFEGFSERDKLCGKTLNKLTNG